MYWYFKYPLLLIAALILLGIGHLIYKQFMPGLFEKKEEEKQKHNLKIEEDNPSLSAKQSIDNNNKQHDLQPRGDQNVQSNQGTSDSVIAEEIEALIEAGKTQYEKDNLLSSRKVLQRILDREDVVQFSKAWYKVAKLLTKVNTKIFEEGVPCPQMKRYVVQPGDTLIAIANQHDTTVRAIQRSNDLDPTSALIYPDMTLQIYKGDWSLEVVISEYALMLKDDGRLFQYYHVGTGRQNRTPTGIFEIDNKLFEPDWTPQGRNVPYGSPENVLGTRWMGLKPIRGTDKTLKGYGIHGTWEPESIGEKSSNGCIRMLNDEVELLFDIVPVGTTVVIKEK